MSQYHRTHRIIAQSAVPGDCAALYDENDLRDAVTYAAETHNEWGGDVEPDAV